MKNGISFKVLKAALAVAMFAATLTLAQPSRAQQALSPAITAAIQQALQSPDGISAAIARLVALNPALAAEIAAAAAILAPEAAAEIAAAAAQAAPGSAAEIAAATAQAVPGSGAEIATAMAVALPGLADEILAAIQDTGSGLETVSGPDESRVGNQLVAETDGPETENPSQNASGS